MHAKSPSAVVHVCVTRRVRCWWTAGATLVALLLVAVWFMVGPPTWRTVPIYMFHRLDAHARDMWTLTPADFERRIEALRAAGYTSVTPAEIVRHLRFGAQLPRKACVITFDDGNASVLRDAAPILERHGFRAVVYLVTDGLSESGAARGEIEGAPALTWSEVRSMQAGGRFVFGGHSVHHVHLDHCADPEAEIRGCAEAIARHTGVRPDSFAYPYGAASGQAAIRRLIRASGYTSAMTVNDRPTRLRRLATDPLRLPRIWAVPVK